MIPVPLLEACLKLKMTTSAWSRLAIIGSTILLSIALFFASPLLLIVLDEFYTTADWTRLSNIGQSFAGISALLAACALVTVAASTISQARQTKILSLQAVRAMQFEIFKLELDDPIIAAARSPMYLHGLDDRERRLYLYFGVLFRYMQFSYIAGELSESSLRHDLKEIFSEASNREWWIRARPYWVYPSSYTLGFINVVDDEHAKADEIGSRQPE
jgi:hypothetical protein